MEDLEKQFEREEFIKRFKLLLLVLAVIGFLIFLSFAIYYLTHK